MWQEEHDLDEQHIYGQVERSGMAIEKCRGVVEVAEECGAGSGKARVAHRE